MQKEIKETLKQPVFTKKQLLSSSQFHGNRDVLHAILKEGNCYTLEEAKKAIEVFQEGEVR